MGNISKGQFFPKYDPMITDRKWVTQKALDQLNIVNIGREEAQNDGIWEREVEKKMLDNKNHQNWHLVEQ